MASTTKEISTCVEIHTNTYASSFGDELVAYLTGMCDNSNFDDDKPGLKEAEEFQKDKAIPKKYKNFFETHLEVVQEEYGPQYFSEMMTPGWFNHGMNGIYEDTPENEIIALQNFKEEMVIYANEHYTGQELKEELQKIQKQKKVDKYGANLSIYMTFTASLEKEHLDFLVIRANEYAKNHNIVITKIAANEITQNVKKKIKKLL